MEGALASVHARKHTDARARAHTHRHKREKGNSGGAARGGAARGGAAPWWSSPVVEQPAKNVDLPFIDQNVKIMLIFRCQDKCCYLIGTHIVSKTPLVVH